MLIREGEKASAKRLSFATVPLVLLIKGEPRGQGVAHMFLLYSQRGQGMAHVSTLQIKPTRPCGLLYLALSSSDCPQHLLCHRSYPLAGIWKYLPGCRSELERPKTDTGQVSRSVCKSDCKSSGQMASRMTCLGSRIACYQARWQVG